MALLNASRSGACISAGNGDTRRLAALFRTTCKLPRSIGFLTALTWSVLSSPPVKVTASMPYPWCVCGVFTLM